ncbi:pheromone processing endoprotease [Entomophthora muscae]|uniref:Pheromone processing endoprotease n=1 Tax=Entomophthora muscae TaxID=34485 RepID=A0ACC2SGJ0_9FUNG|nr:pheromone processing endoprotease [Entomophthora muscae]
MDASYDFIRNHKSPMPQLNDTHGTPCAGIVAAKRHGKCGSGVAYSAKVSGIRLCGSDENQAHSTHALQHENQKNDIYSCSWGPGDDVSKTYPISDTVSRVLEEGTMLGRNGRGNIFVFSSGNSALKSDNCAFNGYANSIYTITVGAVDKHGNRVQYSEGCSSLMTMAYASNFGSFDIHTTANIECRPDFAGTSAATPMVSGVIALVLSRRPELTWRDIQHLLVRSARRTDINHNSWFRTYHGRFFSNQYGFGVVDGETLLSLLTTHRLVENQVTIESQYFEKNAYLPNTKQGYRDSFQVSRELLKPNDKMILEHVVVTFTLTCQQ